MADSCLDFKMKLSRNSFLFSTLCLLTSLFCHGIWCHDVRAASYEEGKQAYLAKDYELALAILKPLAENGDSQAQITLGVMHDFGYGVDKDATEAMRWYIKAAEQGIPVIQHDVGVKYFEGQGVKQDYSRAAYWWEQSASSGLVDSQFNLGLLYYRGINFEIDYQKASSLFTSAAEQEHPHAQYSLAVMHAFGQGFDKDYKKALYWFRKSAAQNVAQAQFNLGVFYENGYGLEKDLASAKKWYELAAASGLSEAESKLAELERMNNNAEQHPDVAHIKNRQPVKVAAQPLRNNRIRREVWAKQQSGKSYTLQLSSMVEEKDIVDFIQKHQLTANAAYVQVVIKGATRFNAIYGSYATYAEAQRAAASLPGSLGNIKPWVRNFGVLQKLIKQKGREPASAGGLSEAKSKPAELERMNNNAKHHPDVAHIKNRQPDKVAAQPPRNNRIRREVWAKQQSGKSYTLQLSSMVEEKDIVDFIQKHQLTANAAYVQVVIKGTTRFNAIYGSYATYAEAQKAAASLPGSLGNIKPWVRNFGVLQKLIKQR